MALPTQPLPSYPQVTDLIVYYDGDCAVCLQSALKFARKKSIVPIEWVDIRSPRGRALETRWPLLAETLHVATSDGFVWTGADAFRMVMWAAEDWHDFACWLDAPILDELSMLFFDWVAAHRKFVGLLLGYRSCETGACSTHPYRSRHA